MKTIKNLSKNILGGVLLASTLGVMTACDPLGVEPTSQVEESQFWGNPQLARAYVDDLYIRTGESASGHTFQSEQWSDNCLGNLQTDWADYRQITFYKRQYDEQSSPGVGPWSGAYQNIRRIYVAIENINAAGLEENLKNQLLAESHFFLAFVYFDMIKFWGTVPYVEKALTLNDETFLPQSKREVVFDNILGNLDKAVEYFNNSSLNSELGRINKDVANAYKSRVALYAACAAEASAKNLFSDDKAGLFKFEKQASHYYQLAYDAANAVTGYDLEPEYETLFTSPTAYKSVESIWPVMFKKDQRDGFNPTAKCGPNENYYTSTPEKSWDWECRGGTYPTQDLVDCYLMKDEATGKWMNWWETSQMVALGVTKGADGEITGSGEDYRKMFENRDKRFYATIQYDGSYRGPEEDMYLIQTWIDDSDPQNTLKFSALHTGMRYVVSKETAPTGYASEQTITSYYLRKYSQLTESDLNEDGSINKDQKQTCYFNIRYAEVLLNKAEAAYKLNKTDYKSLINKIRNRAGIGDYTGNDWWTEYKTQRRIEFAFECPGHRYFDLLRWGQADGLSVIKELNTASRGLWISRKGVEINEYGVGKLGYPADPTDPGYFVPTFKTYKVNKLNSNYDRIFDHLRYYFIPFNKTSFSGYDQIQQNPGWSNFNYND